MDITLVEVETIHRDYWSDAVFGGVKKFEAILKEEHRRNRGWVPNAVGRPACCDSGKLKDLTNRVVQSGGHDVLLIFIMLLKQNFRANNIRFRWYIPDLHDETIYSVHNEDLDRALQIHYATVDELNTMLDGLTHQQCDPKVIRSLAERKD